MIGKCLCGALEFEIDAPFPGLYQCHCSLCRKQGGSVSNTGMIVAADKFRWIAGKSLITEWARDTGFRSYFCSRCGAPVPNPLRDTGYIWIPTGLLEGEELLEIRAQLFMESRSAWDVAPGHGRKFEKAPALGELIAWLHSQSS